MKRRTLNYLLMRRCVKLAKLHKTCIEFPAFGARYPDATCIDGQLYDLDKCDGEGNLYEPGEYIPCPVCRAKEYVNYLFESGYSRAWTHKHIIYIFKRYGSI